MATPSLPAVLPPSRRITLISMSATLLALVLFVASMWFARESFHGEMASNTLSDQVVAAQFAAEALLSTLQDAETGQRGYLLTGNPAYLEPYESARARLDDVFAALQRAPLQDAERSRRIARLHELARSKLAELALTIRLRRAGQDQAALDVVRTDRGKQIMDEIHAEVDALQSNARARLDHVRDETSSPLTWGRIAGLIMLGCMLLAWVAVLQNRAHRAVAAGFARLKEFTLVLEQTKEEQNRANVMLNTIIETAPGLIYAKNKEGRMLLANAATLQLIGKPWAEVEGRTDREFLTDPAQAEVVMANDSHVMASGKPKELEEVIGTVPGRKQVLLSTKTPLKDARGRVMGLVGVSVEITERKQIEERLRQMINELNHRVKNTLATIQSIASQTLRGTDQSIRRSLEMRLMALASAHDALTQEKWEGASLIDIITRVLSPCGVLENGRVRLAGPALRLTPRASLAMAMGLHELAANALKYGALSVDSGRVELSWDILSDKNPRFRLVWVERAGPVVSPPARRGFGTKLIERSLAYDLNGSASVGFEPTGVVCEIQAGVADILAPAEVLPFPQIGIISGS